MTGLVLGSASSGRLRVLRQAGIEPLVVVSDVDENALIASLDPETPPEAVVLKLANAKALSVAAQLPPDVAADCVVIGCDSMLYLDGSLRGKPGSPDAAAEQWTEMAGSVGHLLTGHTLLRLVDGVIANTLGETASTAVHFGIPTAAELSAYLTTQEPLNVAGAFTLDGFGGWLIERIEGDPSNVIGISLPLVRRLLQKADLPVTLFWSC